ncbi:hypothetical protein IQ225_00395, partial [Synechocystis salina LEGE 06155]|nr:hypothetical protein [Synechocystis salina LEGE 06155]
ATGDGGSRGLGGAGGAYGGAGRNGFNGSGANNGGGNGGEGGPGGGGAGLGGGIFVNNSGSLIFLNTPTSGSFFASNQASGGTGFIAGQGLGADLFVRNGGNVFALNPGSINGQFIYFDGKSTPASNDNIQSLPVLSVETAADTKEGSNTPGRFIFTFDKVSPISLTINYRIDGTAGSNDYTFGTLNIPANATSVNLDIIPINDEIYEGNETVVITLESGTYIIDSTKSEATVTIVDNEPLVSVTAGTNPTEVGTVGQFIINLTEPAPTSLSVYYGVAGSALSNSDYNALTGEVFISQGQTQATIDVTSKDDSIYDPDEIITITLISQENYGVDEAKSQATLTIQDNEALPIATITKISDATEGSTTPGKFRITLSSPALPGSPADGGKTIVKFQISGTAQTGTDYESILESVTFSSGETQKEIEIDTSSFDDRIYEENGETVTLTLLAPVADLNNPNTGGKSYILSSDPSEQTATLTIVDNDQIPVASISATTQPSETGPTPGTFTVSLSSPALAGGTTIYYQVSGDSTATPEDDYTALSESITIPEGQSTGVITVTPIDDNRFDPNETVVVTLQASPDTLPESDRETYTLSSSTRATLTIADNDTLPTASVVKLNDAGEDDTTGQFEIRLDKQALAEGVILSYSLTGTATGGTDYNLPINYQLTQGTLFIPEGSAQAQISITPKLDAIAEGTETITLTILNNGTGYNIDPTASSAILNLTDNDIAGIVVSPTTLTTAEVGEGATVAVRLRSQPTAEVTIAVNGLDTTEGSLSQFGLSFTSQNWDTPQSITTTGIDDLDNDGDQSYNLTFQASSEDSFYNNLSATVPVTNLDNDGFDVQVIASGNDTRVVEAGADDTYQLKLTKPPADPVTLSITADSQLLISVDGINFVNQGSVTLSDTNPKTITVRALDNTLVQGQRTALISHVITDSSDPNYPIAKSIAGLTVEIIDNDFPLVSISSIQIAQEPNQAGAFTIALSDPAPEAFNLAYQVDNTSTATADGDYVALTGSVSVAKNAASVTIPVTIINDS